MRLDGIVLGAVKSGKSFKFSSNYLFDDINALQRIRTAAEAAHFQADQGETKIVYGLGAPFPNVVALCGLGPDHLTIERRLDSTRNAAADGSRALMTSHEGLKRVGIDVMFDAKGKSKRIRLNLLLISIFSFC
jgi:hypothetical protein